MHRRTPKVLFLAAATLLLGACGTDSLLRPPQPLDAAAIQADEGQLQQVMDVPALASLIGGPGAGFPIFLRTKRTPEVLLSRAGNLLAAHAQRVPTAAVGGVLATAIGSGAWIDSTLLGKTFVRTDSGYVWDSTRTDAPANGVRVVLYERMNDGSFGGTVVGMLEMVDSSNAESGVIGIARVFDANGASLGGWRYHDTVTGSGSNVGVATVDGALGEGSRQIVFADTLRADSVAGSSSPVPSFSLNTAVPFAGIAVHFRIDNFALSGGLPVSVSLRLTSHLHELRLEETITPDDPTSDSTHVYVDGTLVGLIPPGADRLVAPDGSAPPARLHDLVGEVMHLMQLLPAGLGVQATATGLLMQLRPPV
ncbi:MAG TPA: hypothetical protein VFS44_13620 [Gemmatimonadaceae bacterium]|nr:hypothetical protein [Gemmatimonadaceae bacterium]